MPLLGYAQPEVTIFREVPDQYNNYRYSEVSKELAKYQVFDIANTVHNVLRSPDSVIYVPIRIAEFGELRIVLEPVDLFAHGAFVTLASTGEAREVKNVKHYRGKVEGYPDSQVSFSISWHETVGFIYLDGKSYAFEKMPISSGLPAPYLLFEQSSLLQHDTFNCFTPDEEQLIYTKRQLQTPQDALGKQKCVSVHIEVDYDIYQDKGGLNGTVAFVTGLFNEVSRLYANDNVYLNISKLVVWNQPSPYNGKDSYEQLKDFQAQTNRKLAGDLGALLSYKASGGIAASIGSLCSSNTARRVSFSSIRGNYKVVPNYSWSVMVFAHELGHLAGSRHTHACAWNGNGTAIDGCAGYTEGGCDLPGNPSDGGTIMSYCHLTTNGINLSKGFGQQPGAAIRSLIEKGACLQQCFDDPANPPTGDSAYICTIEVTFDNFANEFGLVVTDQDANQLILVKPGEFEYKTGGEKRIWQFEGMPGEAYQVTFTDSKEDGLCCQYGPGKAVIKYKEKEHKVPEFKKNHSYTVKVEKGDKPKPGGCDVSLDDIVSYGKSQDRGTYTIKDGELLIENNAWKAIEGPFRITDNTYLEFEFKSTLEGEIHGIGFDGDQGISSSKTLKLFGTQNWGKRTYDNYKPGEGWKKYRFKATESVPAGTYQYLFFVADKDNGDRLSNSYFRNVKICDQVNSTWTPTER